MFPPMFWLAFLLTGGITRDSSSLSAHVSLTVLLCPVSESIDTSWDTERENIFIFICFVAIKAVSACRPHLQSDLYHLQHFTITAAARSAISHRIVWLRPRQTAEKRLSILVWTFKTRPMQMARYFIAARVRSGSSRCSAECTDCPHFPWFTLMAFLRAITCHENKKCIHQRNGQILGRAELLAQHASCLSTLP